MSDQTKYKFCLYVTSNSLNSVQAQTNLIALCQTHLSNRYEIDVVDLLKTPMAALEKGIFLTPTLVKLSPPPNRRIIGSLSEMQTVLDIIISI